MIQHTLGNRDCSLLGGGLPAIHTWRRWCLEMGLHGSHPVRQPLVLPPERFHVACHTSLTWLALLGPFELEAEVTQLVAEPLKLLAVLHACCGSPLVTFSFSGGSLRHGCLQCSLGIAQILQGRFSLTFRLVACLFCTLLVDLGRVEGGRGLVQLGISLTECVGLTIQGFLQCLRFSFRRFQLP